MDSPGAGVVEQVSATDELHTYQAVCGGCGQTVQKTCAADFANDAEIDLISFMAYQPWGESWEISKDRVRCYGCVTGADDGHPG